MEPPSEINETISTEAAKAFYDRLGSRHDWFEFYEGQAKRIGLRRLELAPGCRVLNAGSGTGKDHLNITSEILPGGLSVAVDISSEMIKLTKVKTNSPSLQADIGKLPFVDNTFDRLFSSYVIDLIPGDKIGNVISEYYRVLRPGGLMVTVSLTEGSKSLSRIIIAAWKTIYRISPTACGGCRPVQLCHVVKQSGFSKVERVIVEQFGIPSEIVTAIC